MWISRLSNVNAIVFRQVEMTLFSEYFVRYVGHRLQYCLKQLDRNVIFFYVMRLFGNRF